ncbi:MAG TPA: hypothetical protein VIO64_03340 [Pseudobacteroides sp.]|uniref:hypothetical protein n=1 Tax=Pseudobacteroides sp. TaxID=1968840 RepID=UPI002F947DC0
MTKGQFKEAFRRGLGSAYLELKNSKCPEEYKDIVLWCCLHNTCYDMQCEGSRGTYLYNAISLYEDKSFFEDAIIKNFEKKKLDTWLFDQLCDLLYQFANDGSKHAREALYKKYDVLFTLLSRKRKIGSICSERDNFEWLCVWLTSLDGFRAFKRIVEQIGKFYINTTNPNIIFMDWFYSNAKNKFGKKRVDNYMHKNAAKSKSVAAFLNEIESFGSEKPQVITQPSLKELLEACYEPSVYHGRGVAIRFSRTASLEELSELAKIAVTETNPEIKLKLLWAFRKKPFPLDESYVFELAKSDNESIRDVAFDMMSQLSSDRIHDYATFLIKGRKEVANSLSLLCRCYQPGDESLLVDGVKGLPVSYNNGLWHGVYMDIEDLLKESSCRFELSMFMHMYKQTLCSSCRSSLVQTMYKRKILPVEVLEECLYDSYDDTRKFAAKKLR